MDEKKDIFFNINRILFLLRGGDYAKLHEYIDEIQEYVAELERILNDRQR